MTARKNIGGRAHGQKGSGEGTTVFVLIAGITCKGICDHYNLHKDIIPFMSSFNYANYKYPSRWLPSKVELSVNKEPNDLQATNAIYTFD